VPGIIIRPHRRGGEYVIKTLLRIEVDESKREATIEYGERRFVLAAFNLDLKREPERDIVAEQKAGDGIIRLKASRDLDIVFSGKVVSECNR
jgi:hypothetical protein